tara:strand:+ start:2213 stop:2431 length:219 start_codon:yes stop_codon:yes gene_type:complete
MVKGTRKGMARKGAVRGARLAYDNVGASKKRKVGTKVGKKVGVQSAVRKAKARGASARGGVRVAKKVHSMFS